MIVLAHTMKALKLRKVILIYSQMTHNVFCNNEYVENIHKAISSLNLSTNGGGMTITKEADVVGLYLNGRDSMVYYDAGAITNILSFKKIAIIYQITYESDVSKTITVHCKSHGLVDLYFTMHPCSLHILKQENAGSMLIHTLEDNLKL